MSDTTTPPAPRPKGMFCPNCRGVRFTVASRSRPSSGVRVRYLRCNGCEAVLKTAERVVAVTRSPETVPTSARDPD